MLVTIIMLFLVSAMTLAVLSVTANSLHLNQRLQASALAFNIAESGAECGAQWIKDQAYPPNGTTPLDPFGGKVTLGSGTYTVTIYPDASNATQYLKTYRIVSVGIVNKIAKSVEIVVKQSSFGRYAYFTDKEALNSGGAIWWKAGEIIDGPAHSNNTGGTNFNINYNGSNAPIFLDTLTASGSSINYSPSKPKNETTFKKIFSEGSKGFKLGVPKILLPPTTDVQKNAAWGSAASFPTTNGVYLKSNAEGGIYIRGDAQVRLAVDGSGNQQVIVTQGSNTTTVTINKTTGATTTSGPMGSGSITSSSTPPNGVIYCTGNITSLKGTIADNKVVNGTVDRRNALTIATDVTAGKEITVTDNLVYNTKPDKTQSSTSSANLAAGTLGLVAHDVTVSSAAPKNLEIDAVIMAGGNNTTDGSFSVDNYDSKSPTGTLTVLGGIIQKARGAVGTFNSSTGQTTYGYAKNYHYDPRLAENPPPFYPTTGQYDRISWRAVPDNGD